MQRSILGFALCAASAHAQEIQILVAEGDVIAGVGVVDGGLSHPIERLSVGDDGSWIVHADTNNADTNLDEVVLRNGNLVYVEEDPAPAPGGATINIFDAFSLANGTVAWSLTLNNSPQGPLDNWGVYLDATLVALKGSTPPGTWNPGSAWAAFEEVQLVSSTSMVVRGRVDDPVTPQVNDWFCSIWTLDGGGALVAENVIARAGELLPGQTLTINTVRSGKDQGAANSVGQVLYGCDLDAASPPNDAVVYLWDGSSNVLIAQEGMPSGVGALVWDDLIAPELSLNDAGDWVVKDLLATTSATDGIIVKNGVKFRQEGDTLPAIGGTFVFNTFSNAPAQLTASGSVLWFGDWSDPDTTKDTGIFLDDELLVQEGVATAGGIVIKTISGQNGAQYVSPNGRFVIFSGQLADGRDAAFLLDRDQFRPFCFGDGLDPAVLTDCPCGNFGDPGHGCGNSVATGGALLAVGGATVPDSIVLTTTDAPTLASVIYLQGSGVINSGLAFGDGVRCVGGTLVRLGLKNSAGGMSQYPELGDTEISVQGGVSAGATYYYQTYYRNPDPSWCPPATFNITNGVIVRW